MRSQIVAVMATTKVRMPVTEAVMERGESLLGVSDMARDACVLRLEVFGDARGWAWERRAIKAFSESPASVYLF